MDILRFQNVTYFFMYFISKDISFLVMKRSPTSLESDNDKLVVGLIFGRGTTIDMDYIRIYIRDAMLDAREVNGIIHYLLELEGSNINNLILYQSEFFNIPILKYTPIRAIDMRAARKVCIDAIISKSSTVHMVIVENDPTCSLTKILKENNLTCKFQVDYTRTLEEIKEYDESCKRARSVGAVPSIPKLL